MQTQNADSPSSILNSEPYLILFACRSINKGYDLPCAIALARIEYNTLIRLTHTNAEAY
jgi:hypothetical protein